MFAPIRRIWGDGTDDAFSDGINPYKLVAHLKTPLKIFLAAGTGDRDKIQETTKRFHHYLQQKSVSHRYEVFHGDHTWSDWIPVIKQAISEVLF
jgi:enterochelin esterase-like enzyme